MTTKSQSRPRALITGASVGIGMELARVFARNRYDLVLVSRRADALEAVAGRLEGEFGISAATFAADLGDAAAPGSILDFCANEKFTIDMLVNNAGVGLGGEFGESDINRQLNIINVNISALTHLTGLFLPQMMLRRSGRILNVASTAAFQPGPLMAVYYASKAYVLSFSEALAEELRNTGVTVTALCPGPTKTEFAATAEIESTRLFNSVVTDAAGVAEFGYQATMGGKRVAIPGMMNKIVAQSNRFTPRFLATKVVRMLQENR
ncbi:MAG: SDR family oxidoreductase [Gemmatimonadaceae bacterium]|nr:SDR family oxidoreductase [Gemmatimonadaceae bacterium]